MQDARIILGIESSCDDTAAAVVRARPGRPAARSSPPRSRARTRCTPSTAGRARDRRPRPCRAARPRDGRGARARPASALADLDAVAVTAGPGLIGGVLAGVMFAKGLAAGRGLPL